MYKVKIWNRLSTNYGANAFVDANGTDTLEVKTQYEALRVMLKRVFTDPCTTRMVFEGPLGRMTWEQHDGNKPCDCDSYGCYEEREDDE